MHQKDGEADMPHHHPKTCVRQQHTQLTGHTIKITMLKEHQTLIPSDAGAEALPSEELQGLTAFEADEHLFWQYAESNITKCNYLSCLSRLWLRYLCL